MNKKMGGIIYAGSDKRSSKNKSDDMNLPENKKRGGGSDTQ